MTSSRIVRPAGPNSPSSGVWASAAAVSPPPQGFSQGAFGSSSSTLSPEWPRSSAARLPAGPAPATTTSNGAGFIVTSLSS